MCSGGSILRFTPPDFSSANKETQLQIRLNILSWFHCMVLGGNYQHVVPKNTELSFLHLHIYHSQRHEEQECGDDDWRPKWKAREGRYTGLICDKLGLVGVRVGLNSSRHTD